MPTRKSTWMRDNWRPICSLTYIAICIADFIIFPVLWSILQFYDQGTVSSQWNPISLQGGALIHLSFGAFLGIYAHGRCKEKLASMLGTKDEQ